MSKLKKIKDKLSEEDMKEALEVFNFINERYYLKSKKIKGEYEEQHLTPAEKANYIYRQLPVMYHERSMTYILMEQIYFSRNNKLNDVKKIKKLKEEIQEVQNQVEQLQNEIEHYDELKKIQDIDKIIQERDYYKKKCNDFQDYKII